jgi:ArsR family transcriptional regulator, arsenate/arsenite/antimonite-responsive transcriptional repressor
MTEISHAPHRVHGSGLLDDEAVAGIARALAHPVRLRILRILLRERECYCGDLCQEFSLAQSTVSQHLKVLREAGLIRGTRCGTAVGYCVDEDRLAAFREWAGGLGTGAGEGDPREPEGREPAEAAS